jgi:hypothetical protein
VSPARVPLHEGAIVDGNQLVDETPKFALDAEVWVLLPSGPVPGVVVGLNGGEDYAVKTPDGRDLFGVKPSEMRPMEAWETAVVSDRLAESVEPIPAEEPCGASLSARCFNGPDGCPTHPNYPIARCGQLSVHAPHVSDLGPDQPRNCPGVPVQELAYIAPTADGGVVWAMRTKPQCSPECLALDKDFSGYGVKVHLVSCPVGHAEAQR